MQHHWMMWFGVCWMDKIMSIIDVIPILFIAVPWQIEAAQWKYPECMNLIVTLPLITYWGYSDPILTRTFCKFTENRVVIVFVV